MKRGKKCLLLMIVAVMLCGCVSGEPARMPTEAQEHVPTIPDKVESTAPAPVEIYEDPLKEAYEKDPAGYVLFSRSTMPREVYVPVQDIMEYETQYPDCNGTWFKDQLAGEDLCIYNAYLYAMENCFIGFELYVEDNDRDFLHIREAVCLDSPFLEQNINQYGERTWRQARNYIGERVYFGVEQFTESRWEMKLEALEICRDIVAKIPEEYATQLEKMEYLYRYVCDHVEYVSYESMADESFLYDAVCKGETVCDGYSNMLNLLFNLIGVECCEAMGSNIEDVSLATPEELENAEGHTWVVAEVDGEFYNYDPTFEDTAEGFWEDGLMFFGFSDELMAVKYPDRDDMRPKCTDTSRDFSYADLIVENITDGGQIQKIAQLTDQQTRNGQYVTLVAVKDVVTEDDYNSFVSRYAKSVYAISSVETSIMEGGAYTVIKFTTQPW